MKVKLPSNLRLLTKIERQDLRKQNKRCDSGMHTWKCRMFAKYIDDQGKVYCCDHFPFCIE